MKEIWLEENDDLCGTYNTNNQIKLNTAIWKSSLWDYNDGYVAVKGIITVPNIGTAAVPNNRNKKVVFKDSAPFTDYISEINNTQIDKAKDIDIVMNMFN